MMLSVINDTLDIEAVEKVVEKIRKKKNERKKD